jgi:maltokinase
MTSYAQLARLVASAPGDLVLPGGDRRAEVTVATPLALVDAADLGDGRWVAVVADADDDRWTVPLLVEGDGVRRAAPGDGVAERLVAALADVRLARQVPRGAATHAGRSVDGSGPFVADAWHVEDVTGERAITVDQTNESVVVGERVVVKWAVRLPRAGVLGSQPAGERLGALMGQQFDGTPRSWGLLWFVDHAHSSSLLLATLAELIPGADDGWDWAVDDVRRLARGDLDLDAALVPATRLGTLTARLHVALAATGRVAADDRLVAHWQARAYDDLDEAVRVVEGDEGTRLRARAGRIASSFAAFATCVGTPLIHVHGDLHVGQVLRSSVPHVYLVTDFDGNPVLPPEERSAPQPAALDVVGMLASLDHVGRIVIKRTDGVDEAVVRGWIQAAQQAFLHGYRDTLTRSGHADLLDERLLAPLRLQQEVRELLYAERYLPLWRYAPDGALVDLLPDLPAPTDTTEE